MNVDWSRYDPLKWTPDKKRGGNPFYQAIIKLHEKLNEESIPHEFERFFDGYLLAYPVIDIRKRKGDFICHFGSNGHEDDLLEGWGFDYNYVEPYVSWEQAFDVIKSYHNRITGKEV